MANIAANATNPRRVNCPGKGDNSHGRRVPYSAEHELGVLGAALLELVEPPEPSLFYVEGHRRLAEAVGRAAAKGAVTPALVAAEHPHDAALVVEAVEGAYGRREAPTALAALEELRAKRERAAALAAELAELAPPIEPGPEPSFTGGAGRPPLAFTPEVHGAYLNGGPMLVDLEVGPDRHVLTITELRKGEGWDRFPAAVGLSGRARRDQATDLVGVLARDVCQRFAKPGWNAEGRFCLPPPEFAAQLQLGALAGYGEQGTEAGRELWRAIVGELARSPRLALYAGAALGAVFLPVAGLDAHLRPRGFAVHAVGDGGLGKSTAQVVAAAVLGDPKLVTRAWWASTRGLAATTRELGDLPLVLEDTTTSDRPLAEVTRTIVQLFGGRRTLSTRSGESEARGALYRSLVLSTGNERISAGTADDYILRRVVEIEAPLTADAEQAWKLTGLAERAYGWPLAQVIGGAVGPEHYLGWLVRARAQLTSAEAAPVIIDTAIRCSVLVAGAAVLGQLVSAQAAAQLEAAALVAAREVLEARRGDLAENHRPPWQTLLEAVWTAAERRPDLYPRSEEWRELPADGYKLDDGGKLAVFRPVLRTLAAEAGVRDATTALRQLADKGLLYTEGRQRYTTRICHGTAPNLRRSPAMYVFGPQPAETDPRGSGPDADPRGSEGPNADLGTSAEQRDPRDPRDPRAPARDVKSYGPDDRESRPTTTGGTATSRAQKYELDRSAVVAFGAEGLALAPPGPVQSATLSEGDRWHLGELAAAVLANGARSGWLATSLLGWLGLPATLPPARAGEGLSHPVVGRTLAAGWRFERPSARPGLSPLMVLRHDLGPKVELHVPAWGDSGERAQATWPSFAAVDSAEDLAAEVAALQSALWPGRGWALDYSHISTFRRLVGALNHEHPLRPLAAEVEPLHEAELPNYLAAELPTEGYVVAYDRNKSFLSALGTVNLSPSGPFVPAEICAEFFELAGKDQGEQGRLLCRGEPKAGHVEAVFGDGRRPKWLPTSLVGLVREGLVANLRPIRAYTSEGSFRYFRPLADRVRAGLPELAGQAAATAELKRIYSKGIVALERPGDGSPEWYRPDWKAEILGEHVANTWRALARAREGGACLVGTGGRDAALFVVPELGHPPPGLRVGPGIGAWKPIGRPLLASYVAALASKGAGFLDVIREAVGE